MSLLDKFHTDITACFPHVRTVMVVVVCVGNVIRSIQKLPLPHPNPFPPYIAYIYILLCRRESYMNNIHLYIYARHGSGSIVGPQRDQESDPKLIKEG